MFQKVLNAIYLVNDSPSLVFLLTDLTRKLTDRPTVEAFASNHGQQHHINTNINISNGDSYLIRRLTLTNI